MDPAPQPEHAWTPTSEPDTGALPVLSDVDTRPPRPVDPFAVALGNASLLGIGYLLLRRTWLAVLTLVVTVTLVVVLTESTPAVWLEIVVVLWWAALVAHGWFLAARDPSGPGASGRWHSPSGWVTFRKIAIPPRVFEVRTGRQVASFKVEVGGGSCPTFLSWYGSVTPPSNEYVAASPADVRAAFRPLLIP